MSERLLRVPTEQLATDGERPRVALHLLRRIAREHLSESEQWFSVLWIAIVSRAHDRNAYGSPDELGVIVQPVVHLGKNCLKVLAEDRSGSATGPLSHLPIGIIRQA